MSVVKIRHNIRVKEKTFCFFNPKCCEIKAYHSHECDGGKLIEGTSNWKESHKGTKGSELHPPYSGFVSYGMADCGCKYQPLRCSKHNKELMKWRRKCKFRKKWTNEFTKNYLKWRFVKMLTLTLPGYMHIENVPDYLKEDTATYLRNEILTRFRKLTRCEFWNKHVNGGQWFFECNYKNGKANPHFHIMIVGPKKINQEKLQEKLIHYKLGKIAKFSSPKKIMPDGREVVQKMTYWRNRKLLPNKSAIKAAIGYCLKYVTKDEVYDGKNNSYFGCLSGNRRIRKQSP